MISVKTNLSQSITLYEAINDWSAAVSTAAQNKNHSRYSDGHYGRIASEIRNNAKRGGRKDTTKILPLLPIKEGMHVLDIGLGAGEASAFFLEMGCSVTAIGMDISQYNVTEEVKKRCSLIDARMESMPFHSETFDAVWCSHVLEHTLNPGLALTEMHRVLKDEGQLYISVPPFKHAVVGGHVCTGWNMGQLMYALLLSGFDIRNGSFWAHGYNIFAFARKATYQIPTVYSDIGDIELLSNYWPIAMHQGIDGKMTEINWPPRLD